MSASPKQHGDPYTFSEDYEETDVWRTTARTRALDSLGASAQGVGFLRRITKTIVLKACADRNANDTVETRATPHRLQAVVRRLIWHSLSRSLPLKK